MKKLVAVLIGGALAGAIAASHARLPAPTEEQKAAAAEKAKKAAAQKAKDAEALAKAQDRVVAHYKKTKGMSMAPDKASKAPKK